MATSYSYLTFSLKSNKLLLTPQGENCSSRIGGIMSTATTETKEVKAALDGVERTFTVLIVNPSHPFSGLPEWVRKCGNVQELYLVCGNEAEQVKSEKRYSRQRGKLNGSTCYLCELKQ